MKWINRHWKTRIFIIVTILFTAWLIFDAHQITTQANKPTNPDTFMTDIHAMQIDLLGKVHTTLSGPNATHYEQDDTTLFDNPYYITKSAQGPPWHILGDHGKAIGGMNTIILWGHVLIFQPPGKNSQNLTLTTSRLTYYHDRSFAETDQPVTLTQPGNLTHGVGLQADLKTGYIKLLSDSSGQYATKVKAQKSVTSTIPPTA